MKKLVFLLFPIWMVVKITSSLNSENSDPRTTTPYSHISSFLNQRRSNSWDNKPNEFENLNLEIQTTPTKQPITRVQVYKQTVGKIAEDLRERVTNAIAQSNNLNSNKLLEQPQYNKNISENNESSTEFKGLILEDEADGPSIDFDINFGQSENRDGNETELLGLDDSFPNNKNNSNGYFLSGKFKNKTRMFSERLLTPLLNILTSAQRNLHHTSIDKVSGQTDNNMALQLERLEQQNTGSVSTWITNGIKQNLREHEIPLRNVSPKHSNFVDKEFNNNKSVDNPHGNYGIIIPRENSTEIEAKMRKEGLDDSSDKLSFDSSEVETHHISPVGKRLMENEGFGVYILEILGTIVGYTWTAVNYLRSLFSSISSNYTSNNTNNNNTSE